MPINEHLAAWNFTLPVEFILISEAVQPTNRIRLCSRERWNSWGFNRMKSCTSATATWTTSRARRRQVCGLRGSTAIVGHATPMRHSLILKFPILPGRGAGQRGL